MRIRRRKRKRTARPRPAPRIEPLEPRLLLDGVGPDLEVTSLSAPSSAEIGQAFKVSWTVANSGTTAATASTWDDDFFLSDDDVLDASDLWVGYRRNSGPLAAGASYDVVDYELPLGPLGTVARALFVRRALGRIFDFRRAAIAEIFSLPGSAVSHGSPSG